MIGQKFNRLTVLERTDEKLGTNYKYLCQCDCGTIKKISGAHLKKGTTKSCGCLKKETDVIRGRQNQIKNCHKYIYNIDFFNTYSDNLAYFIGLLLADGYVINNTVAIFLSEVDKEILEKIKNSLFINDYPLRKKPSKVSNIKGIDYISKTQYGICLINKKIVDLVKEYGIIQNKTFVTIAPECFIDNRHFWRGVMDGDGSFSITNKRKLVFQASLCGTEQICLQFLNFLNRNSINTKTKPYKENNIYAIHLSHTIAISIHKTLYDNLQDTDWRLKRKEEKLNMYELLYNNRKVK